MALLLVKIAGFIIILELVARYAVNKLRKKFQWFITIEDERPRLDPEGLKKFIRHGYDPELGWVRKPNTWHDERGRYGNARYHINQIGSRSHPGLEDLAVEIACFGDSFTFCRQVNDNETWPWHLSSLTGSGVLNFGVGNYGIDQALMRMKRELADTGPKIVIMGVVPSTIVRILCVWKHYNEFGNTFGFKPRYDMDGSRLRLIRNIIDSEDKFKDYERFLEKIRANDYFYQTKFRDEMIRSPYIYSILRKPGRNIPLISMLLLSQIMRKAGIKNKRIDGYPMMKIMEINKILRWRLFQQEYPRALLTAIIDEFISTAKAKGSKPVFLFLPQKDDVLFIRRRGPYYDTFINNISAKALTIDMTDYLLERADLEDLYSDDDEYGGHFSNRGNDLIASTIHNILLERGYLDGSKPATEIKDYAQNKD